MNNQGGFYCYCKRGYKDANAGDEGQPGTECVEDNVNCPDYSYCVNTVASCDCYEGYYFGHLFHA